MNKLKVAVIDLYQGTPNEGMRGIKQILDNSVFIDSHVNFDLRVKHETPGLDFDCYISGGGPGDPREGDGIWEEKWFALMDAILVQNRDSAKEKKQVFLICHSFQMMCRFSGLGVISKRHSPSFGIFPIYPTPQARFDPLFSSLPDPFYAVDSRSYQVTRTSSDGNSFTDGISILAMEKPRAHVPFEPAIMAARFSPEIIGTQFHPEADAQGMEKYFSQPEKTEEIIRQHGIEKLKNMMASLKDPGQIALTNELFLPVFLKNSYNSKANFISKKI